MHLAAAIELIIIRAPGGDTTASLRVELPTRRADLAEHINISRSYAVGWTCGSMRA